MGYKPDVSPLPEVGPLFPLLRKRTFKVKVNGPTEALALALLWENMLQLMDPSRRERKVTASVTRKFSMTSDVEHKIHPLRKIPDKLWNEILRETQEKMDVDVMSALWAPVLDKQTGGLPAQNIGEFVESRLLPKLYSPGFAKKVLSHFSMRKSASEYTAPGMRVRTGLPLFALQDPEKMVHCQDGPAVVYPDGSTLYYWHGRQVLEEWLPAPGSDWRKRTDDPYLIPRAKGQTLSPGQALNVRNVELRRAACEILGWNRVIDSLNGQVLDQDEDPEIGTLVRVTIPPPPGAWNMIGTQQMFLRVRCGTGRDFALAVPMECRTALEANAWTYGLTPEEYRPEVRT